MPNSFICAGLSDYNKIVFVSVSITLGILCSNWSAYLNLQGQLHRLPGDIKGICKHQLYKQKKKIYCMPHKQRKTNRMKKTI